MKSKPIALVTGGAGFIGSHTVDLLVEKGYCVRIIDDLRGGHLSNLEQHSSNPDVQLIEKNILSINSNDSAFSNCQFLIHFAGIGDIVPSIDNPVDYMQVNVMGTVKILEAARYAGINKFVYAASSSCYGLAEDVPTKIDCPISPKYPYALSKYQGEQAVKHWGKVYSLPFNVIRIFNAYGPRVRTTGAYGAVFGVFLKQKLSNKPFTVVGDGSQTRDFIFVTDLAKAFYLAATSDLDAKIYNVGASKPQSINYLVELLGGGEVIYLPKREGEPDCTWADTTEISNDLGWNPEISFEDGVARMLECIDDWQNAPLWDESSIAEATKGWHAVMGD